MGGRIDGLILVWWPSSGGDRVLGVRAYAKLQISVSLRPAARHTAFFPQRDAL